MQAPAASNSGVLFLYLPTLAFWAAFAKLLLTLRKEQTTLTGRTALRLWYLTAGSALLLNQYPRMDAAHMVWSGGVLLVVGADLLHAWYQSLLRRLPRPRGGPAESGRGAERSAPADHGGSPSGLGSPPRLEPVRGESSCSALSQQTGTCATLCATDSGAVGRLRLGSRRSGTSHPGGGGFPAATYSARRADLHLPGHSRLLFPG